MIDLHVHTTASDGTFTPAEVVRLAYKTGLKAIAITDHDTIAGLPGAVAEGTSLGYEVVPGVEISVDYAAGEMHLLGYYVDMQNPFLNDTLQQLVAYREERNPKIIARLRELGCDISLDEVVAEAGGEVVGRPHIAAVLVRKGYVPGITEAFERYLADGRPAYVKKERLTPEEGLELILKSGGLPFLAHPKYLKHTPAQLDGVFGELKQQGLKGVEVYYTTHTPEETALYRELALRHNLLISGGTDFHGANKPDVALGLGNGSLSVPYSLLENIKAQRG